MNKRCMLMLLLASLGLGSVASAQEAPAQEAPAPEAPEVEAEVVIPPENSARLKKPLPFPDEAQTIARAKLLVQAMREDKPEIALPFFFPQGAFREVKGIKDPDRYFRKLTRVYLEDVATMRASLRHPDKVEFVSFTLGRQKRWVERGKEANKLPYWANYKGRLVVKDGDREVTLPLRVMITWGQGWYVTHLTRK